MTVRGRIELKIIGATFSLLLAMLVVSVIVIISWQREEIYSLAGAKLADVAEFATSNFEREMLAGRVDAARMVSGQMALFKEIESVTIYNRAGREAFLPKAPPTEALVLKQLSGQETPIIVRRGGQLVVYRSLPNRGECRGCHAGAGKIIGAVKITIGLRHEQARVERFAWLIAAGGLLGTIFLGLSLWFALHRIVVTPLQALGEQAARMAVGDLSFDLRLTGNDEIVRLQDGIRDALSSVSGILRQVSEVTSRVALAAGGVEQDSAQVVAFTELEARAMAEISGSVGELNVSIREIAGNVEGLASTVHDTSASVEEMAASIAGLGGAVHELTDGVEATSSSIEELSATFREVVDGAGELDQVSDTMLSAVEQIIASICEVEWKVTESARLSERVTAEASTIGSASIVKTSQKMARIKGNVEGTARALEQLDGRSEEIGKIITVIGGIADQTTLLALNAAILAAQVGEKGKGFAVVASEMKNLAQRTAVSAKEIEALIAAVRAEVKCSVENMHEVRDSVDEGMTLSGEVADSFQAILNSTRSSSEMTLSIERTTGEQARIATLVSESVGQVRTMAKRVALATSEQATVIAYIAQAIEKIRDASLRVRLSSDQQTETSSMISQAVENILGKSRQIEQAINAQKLGTGQILSSIEGINDIPRQSKDIAFGVNRRLREVVKDVELIGFEMGSFTLYEEDRSVLKFGIVPVESPVEMYRRYTPLAGYLCARLGRPVELRVAPNFETALKELGEGVTSFCSMTTSVFIEAQERFGARTLVTVLRNGTPCHRAVVVARENGPVRSLADLKGGSCCFVDPKAATGYVLPRAMLQEAGVELADLAYYNFTGAHDEVARAVLRGEFDAGGMMESTAAQYRHQGLRVLQASEEVPQWNICCAGMDLSLQGALQQALLDLDQATPEGRRVLESIETGCSGFVRSSSEDHDGLRELMHRFGLLGDRPESVR